MMLALAGASYVWVYYQPLMNRRMNVEHCNNAFAKAPF